MTENKSTFSAIDVQPDLDSVLLLDSNNIPSEFSNELLKAKQYLLTFDWLKSVDAEYLGASIDGIIYIFLFKISSNQQDVDPWVWVIVGDLPSAYITCEDAKNPFEALDGYLGAMEEWVHAAENSLSVASLIPVNVEANPENALKLKMRLEFLDKKILHLLK